MPKGTLVKKNEILTREKLFRNKEKFHKEQAKLSFAEKINILVELQKIAFYIKGDSDKIIWDMKDKGG